LIYTGPFTTHHTTGNQYRVLRTFEHPLLGPVAEVPNDLGGKSLVTKANKTFREA